MLDLTGANLAAYMLRVIKDIVNRHPRFRNTLGDVLTQSNQMVQWGNLQATIKNISASGTRLSPDYFMETARGRVTVAKVGDKAGSFVEWPLEIDPTRQTPQSGVYYLNIDATSEKDQSIDLTLEKYKWSQGKLKNAQGSIVYFDPLLRSDGSKFPGLPALDITTLIAIEAETGNQIQYEAFNSSTGGFMYILEPCQTLLLSIPGSPAIPLNTDGSDYWYERTSNIVICFSTLGGQELLNIPVSFVSATFTDQDNYQLRQGVDFQWQGPDWINLSTWSPKGSVITANVLQKIPPVASPPNMATNPENIIDVGAVVGQDSLALGEVFFHTPAGDFPNVQLNADGTVTLPRLLTPGQWLRWEVRLNSGFSLMRGKKYQMNGFIQTVADVDFPDDPSKRKIFLDDNGKQVDPIPGLWLAIGDNVVVGDQVAIVVNPEVNETYEVFGSKDNVSFVLEMKSNDYQTASDLSELVKSELLVFRRTNTERDGLTILEAPRDMSSKQRDVSGVNPEFTVTQTFNCLADWKVYVPLVTRMVSFELQTTGYIGDFPGKIQLQDRVQTLGATQFLTSYV